MRKTELEQKNLQLEHWNRGWKKFGLEEQRQPLGFNACVTLLAQALLIKVQHCRCGMLAVKFPTLRKRAALDYANYRGRILDEFKARHVEVCLYFESV